MPFPQSPARKPPRQPDVRRWLMLVLSVGLIIAALLLRRIGGTSAVEFASAACFRIGLVFAAIWLAWDSLRTPARWFPPVVAAGGVVLLAVLAAQPKLFLVLGPAFGLLLMLGAVVRSMRRH